MRPTQSERRAQYLEAFRRLLEGGFIYPCTRSRKDVASAALAPHEEEPIFPVEWRAQRLARACGRTLRVQLALPRSRP